MSSQEEPHGTMQEFTKAPKSMNELYGAALVLWLVSAQLQSNKAIACEALDDTRIVKIPDAQHDRSPFIEVPVGKENTCLLRRDNEWSAGLLSRTSSMITRIFSTL